MQITTLILILLLALCAHSSTGLGETIAPDPAVNKPHSQSDEGPAQSTAPLQPMDITQPPPEKSAPPSFFYPYQSSLSLVVGPLWQPNSPNGIYELLGIDYTVSSATNFHWEFGFETITLGEGHLWGAARWNLSSSKKFRPYYSAGMGVRLIPQDALATFLQLADFFPRVAVGAEYSLQDHSSVCAEIAAASDFQGNVFATLTFEYSWGF